MVNLGQDVFYRNNGKWYAAKIVGILPFPPDFVDLVVFNHLGTNPCAKVTSVGKYDPANPLNNTWYETQG